MAWNTLFNKFPDGDQCVWSCRASRWYNDHKVHVESLILEEKESYPPSGSDCGKPELWKAGHWNWFFTGKTGRIK